MSLKSRIIEYCKQRPFEWVHKGTLGRLAVTEWNYENENLGRRCRELETAGILEVRYTNGQAEYKYKGIMQRIAPEKPPEKPQEPKQISLI